jgi:CMP-N-acetylneuraminic acid synthetase
MIIYIPIKHNSQRVPRKNFRMFEGELLYKHTLLKFRDERVFVDTDSEEIYSGIKNDKRFTNVTVFYRDNNLIGDKISVCDLLESFILRFEIKDPVIQIHVTSPFLLKNTIKEAYHNLGKHDSVVSCNIHQTRFWRKEDYGMCPINHNPLKLEQTQDLPILYEENSCFYIFKPEVLLRTGNRVGIDPYFFPISEPENMDIDIEKDWESCLERSTK